MANRLAVHRYRLPPPTKESLIASALPRLNDTALQPFVPGQAAKPVTLDRLIKAPHCPTAAPAPPGATQWQASPQLVQPFFAAAAAAAEQTPTPIAPRALEAPPPQPSHNAVAPTPPSIAPPAAQHGWAPQPAAAPCPPPPSAAAKGTKSASNMGAKRQRSTNVQPTLDELWDEVPVAKAKQRAPRKARATSVPAAPPSRPEYDWDASTSIIDTCASQDMFAKLEDQVLQQQLPCALGLVLYDVETNMQPFCTTRRLTKTQEAAIVDHGNRVVSGRGAAHAIAVVVQDPMVTQQPPTCFVLRHGRPNGSDGRVGSKQVMRLVNKLLTRSNPITCCGLQVAMQSLLHAGAMLPPIDKITAVDPVLLCWMHEPHLCHKEGKIAYYGLHELLHQHGMEGGSSVAPAPACSGGTPLLQQLQADCVYAMQLHRKAMRLLQEDNVPHTTIAREMQVAVLLAGMETQGMYVNPQVLQQHEAVVTARKEQIQKEADALSVQAGGPATVDLQSPMQVADWLFEHLRLPEVQVKSQGSAKTHRPTNDPVLQELVRKTGHPAPSMVLEHRRLANFSNKWLNSGIMQQLIMQQQQQQQGVQEEGAPVVLLQCQWNQTATATGRLSSSNPNMQAITKYTIEVQMAAGAAKALPLHSINIRDAFVAPPGHVLLACDYNQIELRMLAHISGAGPLTDILRAGGDTFTLIAQRWLGANGRVITRDQAKRVAYGIIYGQTHHTLAVDLGMTPRDAGELIQEFKGYFHEVQRFVNTTQAAALSDKYVRTFAGRRRPLPELDKNSTMGEGKRKAVNSRIQGSAADLMKAAMVGWEMWALQQQWGHVRPVRLIAQIHDELLFVVDPSRVNVPTVARDIVQVMTNALRLSVPLSVSVKVGNSMGNLAGLEL